MPQHGEDRFNADRAFNPLKHGLTSAKQIMAITDM